MHVCKCCALLSKSKQCALVLFNANLIQAITVLSVLVTNSPLTRHLGEICMHSICIQPPLLWLTTVTAMAVSTSNKSAMNSFLHRKQCFVAVQCAWVLPTHLAQNSQRSFITGAVATASCYATIYHCIEDWIPLVYLQWFHTHVHCNTQFLTTTTFKIIRLLLDSLPTFVLL